MGKAPVGLRKTQGGLKNRKREATPFVSWRQEYLAVKLEKGGIRTETWRPITVMVVDSKMSTKYSQI